MSYWGEIEIIQNSQDKVNAVSNVTANFYACSSSYAGWSNYTTYPVVKLHNTQETQTLKSFDFRKSLKILIGSITTNVQHNADGTMSVSASFTWDSDHSLVGTLTGSATKTLTTIPRASKVFATDANIGSSSTITINKADNSFTHTLEYSFEGLTGTIIEKTSQESVGWAVPTSFFQKIPENQNGTVTITCKTYSGDTLVGTSSTTITAIVPTSGSNSSMPIIESATAVDTNPDTIELTGNSSRLVNYFSNVKISAVGKCLDYGTFSVLKSNNQSMEIKNKTSSNGTTTVNGEITHNSNEKSSFTIFIGDKRGLWAQRILNEGNGDFTIVPYIPLTMNVEVERKSQTSNSIKMKFSGNFYNGYYDASKKNFNNLKIKWRYKLTNSGSWITEGADDTTNGWHNLTLDTDFKYDEGKNTYQSNGEIIISDLFDYQTKYIVEINYSDGLSSYSVQKPLPEGIPNHDYGVDDEGNNYFNVNGDIYKNGEALKIQACNKNQTLGREYTSSQFIAFTREIYNNSNGKIIFNNDGLITINHTGYMKVSFCVWVHAGSNARPWGQFVNYSANDKGIDVIGDNSSGYICLSAANCIIPVSKGEQFGLSVYTNTETFGVDRNNTAHTSYMTIELI